jgi:molybdenum cofactor cytidylyltransferase
VRAAIVLAGGSSRRFGRGNKLLARLGGRPLLLHAIERARAGGAVRVIVVTGADRARVAALLKRQGVAIVHAPDHARGMSATLRAGIAELRPVEREVLIYLGDMPFVPEARRWRLTGGIDAMRPVVAERPGHPVLVRSAILRRIPAEGDRGLAPILSGPRTKTGRGRAAALFDVDSRTALRNARRHLR